MLTNLISNLDTRELENGEIQVYQNDNLHEINNLCREVEEVHDIFIDMALLVDNQGHQIDNIQTNIEFRTEIMKRCPSQN